VFEWDNAGGDAENYPRLRFNEADTTAGVFTQYGADGAWTDHPGADASIKITLE
jgi:hypothetical protein